MSLELKRPGWLGRLLELFLQTYDPLLSLEAVRLLEAAPGASRAERARQLTLRRLEGLGLRAGPALIPSSLEQHLSGLEPAELGAIGLLTTQWQIVLDIAALYEDAGASRQRLAQILTVMALSREDYKLARRLEQRALTGRLRPGKEASQVEKLLPGRTLPIARSSLSIGVGLAYLEAKVLARVGSLYFERPGLPEDEIRRIHDHSLAERVELLEVLITLAWADGVLSPEERALIDHQLLHARLPAKERSRLKACLEKAPKPSELLLDPVEDDTRRFILEQAVLLTLIDDEQSEAELDALKSIAARLGGSPQELEEVLVGVYAFYERHRGSLQGLSPLPKQGLGRLRGLVAARAQAAVASNLRAVVTEVKETGELARLLGVASVRPLSPEEAQKVRAQLVDVARTVPALAIFALPGGGLLLPILVKALPFQILPSAFATIEGSEGSEAAEPKPS